MTEGALYHHFSGKKELFGVVFEQVKRELSSQIAPALQTADPWTGIAAACRAYIEQPGGVAPGRPTAGAVMFRGAFRRAMNRGVSVRLPLNTLAMIVTGALAERAPRRRRRDPQAARTEPLGVVLQLLEDLHAER